MRDFKKSLKALVLLLCLALLLPLSANAQYYKGSLLNDDPTANWQREGLMNRDVIDLALTGISNYGIGQTEVPLGSGLLILTIAGAGYAAMRRKRSRKSAALLLSCVLLIGFTQCKKDLLESQAESVHIILTVDDGSKVAVTLGFEDPETHEIYAKVTFENGDRIYVGNNGKYCGYLDYTSTGENTGYFSGTVAPESENDYLHFYFMGNKTPIIVTDTYSSGDNPTINGYSVTPATLNNNTVTFSVNITDQTVKYPVISYAHSTQTYTSGVTTYSAKLQNYCSIMKFKTTDLPTTNPITLSGLFDKVTVDFAANNGATTGEPYRYDKMGITDEGDITLHAESTTERWAIVLPYSGNNRISAGASAEGCYSLKNITIPRTERNKYYASGTVDGWVSLPIKVELAQLIDGAFSINNGDPQNNILPTQVFFAPGNLQCTTSANPDASGNYDWSSASYTWSFKVHQYDVDNYANSFDVGENCKKVRTISHFNWATSGWDNTEHDEFATNYQPYATDFTDYAEDQTNRYHYGPTRKGTAIGTGSTDTVNLRGNYANYDWGVFCSITNGGEYSWRLLTEKEQSYILGPNTNPRPGGNCRRSSTVNGVPNARFIKACLTDASNGEGQGLYGLIVFPDTYIHPSSNLAPLPQKINDPLSKFTDNNYTIAQWTEMEKAKAVFLPAAGCRWGDVGSNGLKYYKIQDINKHCYYWSSSDDVSHVSTHAKNMRIGIDDFVSSSYTQRVRGNCVRLVRIATATE